jgi:two-component system, NtrC family, response regulator AtoC
MIRKTPPPPSQVVLPSYAHTTFGKKVQTKANYMTEGQPVQLIQDLVTTHLSHREDDFLADKVQCIEEDIGANLVFTAASPLMRKVYARAQLLARVDAPILITGESGSGKDLLARLIHKLSDRSMYRFAKVSCAALGPEALERGLFDSEKTRLIDEDAEITPFRLCHKGTLLLDDIDELSPRAQAKLACFLQDKQDAAATGDRPDADVRVLATTKVNLESALSHRQIRKELYYSLSAFTVALPPLRQRKDEIPLLLKHLMWRIAANYGLPMRNFSPAVLRACVRYPWPGNLSELEKFVKRYIISSDDETPSILSELDPFNLSMNGWNSLQETGSHSFEVKSVPSGSASGSLLHCVRKEAERDAISAALEQTRWNRTAAARLLNVSYRSLLYKIQQYDLNPKKY